MQFTTFLYIDDVLNAENTELSQLDCDISFLKEKIRNLRCSMENNNSMASLENVSCYEYLLGSLVKRLSIPNSKVKVPPPAVDVI